MPSPPIRGAACLLATLIATFTVTETTAAEEPMMKTERSTALVAQFQQQAHPNVRKVIEVSDRLPAGPDEIFPLLCPARERDWIPGWTCELIYTESGYAEPGCIFRTAEDNISGPGLWICTRYEAPYRIEYTRVMEHMVMHLTIVLDDGGDGTTTGRWTLAFTGLDRTGSEFVARIPDDTGDAHEIFTLLRQYLQTGDVSPDNGEGIGHAGHGHGGQGHGSHGHGGHSIWEVVKGHFGQ